MGYERVPNEDLQSRLGKWFVDAKQDPLSDDIMRESLTAVNLVNKWLQVQLSWQCRTCLPRSLSESAGCVQEDYPEESGPCAALGRPTGATEYPNISPIGKPPAGKRELICLLFGTINLKQYNRISNLSSGSNTILAELGRWIILNLILDQNIKRAVKVDYSRHVRLCRECD